MGFQFNNTSSPKPGAQEKGEKKVFRSSFVATKISTSLVNPRSEFPQVNGWDHGDKECVSLFWGKKMKEKFTTGSWEKCLLILGFTKREGISCIRLHAWDHYRQARDFLSCKSHKAICIPKSRTSNKISSKKTFNQHNNDLFCNDLASMTASDETFPMIRNVWREDACNCSINISINVVQDFTKQHKLE